MKEKRPAGPIGTREADMKTRESDVGERELSATGRESTVSIRESTATVREDAMAEREDISRTRESALSMEEQARALTEERIRLSAQIREANERLVLATLRADELADEANAARIAMSESEERYRTLVTTSSAVIWHADETGLIRFEEQGWHAFTGLGLSASVAEADWSWLEAVHPDERTALRAAWLKAVKNRKPFVFQHRLRRPDGTWSWVMSRAVPIPETGPVREWLGMMADITDRIRVEEARERFIGILGHDLRTPLGSILGGAQILARADLPAESAKTIARIDRSARRIDAIIGDVLDFARGRLGGGIPVKPAPCDLGLLCLKVVDETKGAFPGRAIRFDTRGDLTGEWDANRLEQVVSNLLANAIHHGSDPIRIEAGEDGAFVVLTVENQGAPIPEALLGSLFEPFRRDEKDSKGLGLGLYIVSEIVRAHGATISVRSTEAEGTAFTIRWPRRPVART